MSVVAVFFKPLKIILQIISEMPCVTAADFIVYCCGKLEFSVEKQFVSKYTKTVSKTC